MTRDVPVPKAPTAEEWEPFLRAERPTDLQPMIFTERQVARMQYILSAVLETGPSSDRAREQLAALENFLAVSLTENGGKAAAAPSARTVWDRIEAMPHYLQPSRHLEQIENLRRRGLDPYGNPLNVPPE